tara:strand:+ start:95 stop:478 length:384 start_codon:yes stop_codon:yes gene_type:complete
MNTKLLRPSTIPSLTWFHGTGSHAIQVTIGFIDGEPKEVFMRTGVNHEHTICDRAWIEALARSISTGLRYGVPPDAYIDQFQGISCMSTFDATLQRVIKSPADYLAQILKIVARPEFVAPTIIEDEV